MDDAFSHLQEEVLGGNGGGRQYAVTKEKFTHLAVASLRIAVVHKPGELNQHNAFYNVID